MLAFMVSQMSHRPEAPGTACARVWTLARVNAHVHRQIRLLSKRLPTTFARALEHLLPIGLEDERKGVRVFEDGA